MKLGARSELRWAEGGLLLQEHRIDFVYNRLTDFFLQADSSEALGGRASKQRVWGEILAGGYVAQELVSPGERAIDAEADKPLKFDLRAYAYDGVVQWNAARLYQGQTTNFRTPGGGFAPVYEGPF